MTKLLNVIVTVALMALTAGAQTAANSSASAASNPGMQASAAGTLASGTTIPATLSKSIDAKKAKNGDEVAAKTTQEVRSSSGLVIPKGSKLIGHVTDAKARAKGDSQSSLAIAFDTLKLKNGQQVPIHANIQALAAPPESAPVPLGEDTNPGVGAPSPSATPMGGRGNAGVAGPMGSTAGGVANPAAGASPSPAGVNANTSTAGREGGELSPSSTGVIGLNGIQLSAASSNNSQGSVITSSGKDLKLNSGTRVVLQVQQ